MARTERKVVTISSLPNNNSGGSYARSTGSSLPMPGSMQDPSVPSFFGRPTDSIWERIFPYHALVTFSTVISIINACMFIATLAVGAAMFDGAFVKDNSMGGPSTYTLRYMGGKWEPWIVEGQVWRLLTPIVLHTGLLHFVSNLFFQLRFGWVLEARWGVPRTVLIYIVSGVAGNCMSCFLAPYSVSVGASGALFGILGADVTYLAYNWAAVPNAGQEALMLGIILVINLIFGFTGKGVDNWAHLGGIIFGMLCGLCVPPPLIMRPWEKTARVAAAVVTVAMLGLFIGLIWICHPKQ